MKSRGLIGFVGLLVVALVVGDAMARGRGGGGRGGGGGRSMGGGGRSRSSASRSSPSMSRSPSYNRGGQSSRSQPSRSQAGNRAGQPSRGQAGNRAGQQTNRGQAGNRAGQQAGRGQAGNRAGQNPFTQGQGGGRGQAGNRAGSGPGGRASQNDINKFLNISPSTGNAAAAAGGAGAGAALSNRNTRPGTSERGPGSERRDQRTDNRQARSDTRQDRRESRPNTPADRAERRQERGDNIRNEFHDNHPRADFWKDHPHAARWRVNRPYRWATWGALGGWYALSGDGQYYDYGSGGNCYYEDDMVYYEGEPVATAEEYADQAIGYAEAGAQTIENAVASNTDIEWMPLGVFALVHEDEGEPTFFMQLQLAQDGTISGTYVNSSNDSSQTIQGAVDKESQRAAWSVGSNSNTVIETGLYNLTMDEAPALIHFGTEKTQEWLLVRMEDPEAQQ